MAARLFKSETQPLNRGQNPDSKVNSASSGHGNSKGTNYIMLCFFKLVTHKFNAMHSLTVI